MLIQTNSLTVLAAPAYHFFYCKCRISRTIRTHSCSCYWSVDTQNDSNRIRHEHWYWCYSAIVVWPANQQMQSSSWAISTNSWLSINSPLKLNLNPHVPGGNRGAGCRGSLILGREYDINSDGRAMDSWHPWYCCHALPTTLRVPGFRIGFCPQPHVVGSCLFATSYPLVIVIHCLH